MDNTGLLFKGLTGRQPGLNPIAERHKYFQSLANNFPAVSIPHLPTSAAAIFATHLPVDAFEGYDRHLGDQQIFASFLNSIKDKIDLLLLDYPPMRLMLSDTYPIVAAAKIAQKCFTLVPSRPIADEINRNKEFLDRKSVV